ncbi:glycosyltransferase [Elizabethkingia sp. JS20170427COW]|uniref:glycosyltransferase n=1 Tax=Elizabethkingia sp. JS20170427COW TaxID=2583851 RepID=UPI0011103AB3|nr:glycosyltransferase [Elizabethkingia sp. JS20170427COW]QCX53340.1 glycosyltransferase [Elizabethkingia sp. JS20170427COW]
MLGLKVNYHGFFDGNFGIAEATRLNELALLQNHIEVNRISYQSESYLRTSDIFPDEDEVKINIFHININTVNAFFEKNNQLKLQGRYNILYWAWEFPEVPEQALKVLNFFDELWVPSDFCVNIFTQYTGIPVLKFPHPIQKVSFQEIFDRGGYKRVFLTIFDSFSTTIRKNPHLTIEAFLKVFGEDKEAVLIVKTHNLDRSKDTQKVLSPYMNLPNVKIINEDFSKEKLHGLIQASDVLISLHGSEGFGLTMAEAMAYGKVVVGTGYSGNLEFMNVNNSFLVRYNFIQTHNTKGLIAEGLTLAQPDVDHACEQLQYIKSHFGKLSLIQENAQNDVGKHLSLSTIGTSFKNRISYISSHLINQNSQIKESADQLFYITEIESLKNRIQYLERTLYNKVRKKINTFFLGLRNKK